MGGKKINVSEINDSKKEKKNFFNLNRDKYRTREREAE
jgi:hypothetical protein